MVKPNMVVVARICLAPDNQEAESKQGTGDKV